MDEITELLLESIKADVERVERAVEAGDDERALRFCAEALTEIQSHLDGN
jgi:hypothetical protein